MKLRIRTPETRAEEALERAHAAAKAECQRRIYEVCDQHAQMNLAAACAAGLLSDADLQTYKEGLIWVNQMRAVYSKVARGQDEWPPVPKGVKKLADRY